MEIKSNAHKGNLTISEEAIEAIAMNSAKDIEGFSSFSNRPNDVVTTIKQKSIKVMSPVRVHQDGDSLTVSIYINVLPNVKIKEIASAIQKNVKDSIQNMTGKLVAKVNVVIAGIDFESDDSTEPNESED